MRSLPSLLCLLSLAASPAVSQVGHPAKGSWSGYWGPSASEQNRILLLLDWTNNQITGTINPGRNGVSVDRAELDISTWTLTLEADLPVDGSTRRFVITGKLDNLGSWTNRRFIGTYTLGAASGSFAVTLN